MPFGEPMIESPTVFVLGAGAHCSYGFPSGEELIAKAISAVKADEGQFLALENIGAAKLQEVQPARAMAFADALTQAGQSSIDAFLNANRHQVGFQPIGKAAIAQVLLEYERKTFPRSDDDWLTYLFRVLLDQVNSPAELTERNKIGFITFNYDRFLELWLHERIIHSFGIDEKSALDVLRRIPIYHVYGMLGEFPISNTTGQYDWLHASTGIRTIFDTGHDESTLDAAKNLLANAHVICLLGFGFHRENIDLLDLSDHGHNCPGIVASSRYGITDEEWRRLMKKYFPHRIVTKSDSVDQKCLDTLRHLPIF